MAADEESVESTMPPFVPFDPGQDEEYQERRRLEPPSDYKPFGQYENQQCYGCNKIIGGKFEGKRMHTQVHNIDAETGEGHTETDMAINNRPYNTGHGICENCQEKFLTQHRQSYTMRGGAKTYQETIDRMKAEYEATQQRVKNEYETTLARSKASHEETMGLSGNEPEPEPAPEPVVDSQ